MYVVMYGRQHNICGAFAFYMRNSTRILANLIPEPSTNESVFGETQRGRCGAFLRPQWEEVACKESFVCPFHVKFEFNESAPVGTVSKRQLQLQHITRSRVQVYVLTTFFPFFVL